MLTYNHYLEELGIKKTDFPFGDENDDPRYEVDEEGFRECEFWSLDYSLACYIYSHLCYFRDYCLCGHPLYVTEEQWEKILNKMIKGFKLYITENSPSKNQQKQITYGMKLFIKHFGGLWF